MNPRKANKSDLDITYRIKTNSIKPYVEKMWGWNESDQKEAHKVNFIISDIKIIEYNQKEVGYMALKEDRSEIYLENLLIEKEFQGLGIGEKVMETIIEKADRQEKRIKLQVLKINVRAKKFYENLGLERVSENDDHIGMVKNRT